MGKCTSSIHYFEFLMNRKLTKHKPSAVLPMITTLVFLQYLNNNTAWKRKIFCAFSFDNHFFVIVSYSSDCFSSITWIVNTQNNSRHSYILSCSILWRLECNLCIDCINNYHLDISLIIDGCKFFCCFAEKDRINIEGKTTAL